MYDVLVFDHRLGEHRPLDSKSELARLLFGYTTGNGQRFPAQPDLAAQGGPATESGQGSPGPRPEVPGALGEVPEGLLSGYLDALTVRLAGAEEALPRGPGLICFRPERPVETRSS